MPSSNENMAIRLSFLNLDFEKSRFAQELELIPAFLTMFEVNRAYEFTQPESSPLKQL
jgi:hypothetical protein